MIAVPDFLRHLPVDRRGYPVPATVLIDDDGDPHFTINDEEVRQQLIAKNRCPICGKGLPRLMAWVGGPNSAFHEAGAYIDTALHLWCARYALQACPYLAAPRYAGRIDDRTLRGKSDKPLLLQDPTMDPTRPDPFVLVTTTGWDGERNELGWVRLQRPKRPYRLVEFWRHGRQVEAPADLLKRARELTR